MLGVIGVKGYKGMPPNLGILMHHACISSTGRWSPRNSITNLVKSDISPKWTQSNFSHLTHKFDKLLIRRFSCKIVRLLSLRSCFWQQTNVKFWQPVFLQQGTKPPKFIGVNGDQEWRSLVQHCRKEGGLNHTPTKISPNTPNYYRLFQFRPKLDSNLSAVSLLGIAFPRHL